MKLTEWLMAERLTMVEFAKQVGVTHSAVSRWCRGVFPKESRLVLIREVTGGAVSAEDFMPAVKSSNPSSVDHSVAPKAAE